MQYQAIPRLLVNDLARGDVEIRIQIVPVVILRRTLGRGQNVALGGDAKLRGRIEGGDVRLAPAGVRRLVAVNLFLLGLAAHEFEPKLVTLLDV